MTRDAEGGLPRLPHQEVLEGEQTRADHIINVLSIC